MKFHKINCAISVNNPMDHRIGGQAITISLELIPVSTNINEDELMRLANSSIVDISEDNIPDISMCKGNDCPAKAYCYRYTATPNDLRQSFFLMPPEQTSLAVIKKDRLKLAMKACSYFWATDEKNFVQLIKPEPKGKKNLTVASFRGR